MNKEIWDILDSNGNLTGKTAVRGKCFLKPGEYHLVVHIWIVSSDGKFLLQRRSDSKKLMPGEWAATGGAAVSGESSYEAAKRELFEELSIESNENTLKKILRLKRRNSLLDVWMIVCDKREEQLTLQKSEVAEVRWVDESELQDMISKGLFHNYGKEYFTEVLKEIEQHKGVTV
ncbi:MAG: NUDIX domain-containing protein [Ruminococcaceae bacterium]|nr:NUDIX domain-containing protein [Oscillospiraceae bacterium]